MIRELALGSVVLASFLSTSAQALDDVGPNWVDRHNLLRAKDETTFFRLSSILRLQPVLPELVFAKAEPDAATENDVLSSIHFE